MEEGGGNSENEVKARLDRWKELYLSPLVDNYEFHRKIYGHFKIMGDIKKINLSRFFDKPVRLQRTWAALIRTILNIEKSSPIQTEMVKQYQSQCWGRLKSNNCLIELFPLPSPNANDWHYDEWSNLPSLKSRETYISNYKESRVNLIKSKLRKHSPKYVFFYSLNPKYIEYWEDISDIKFNINNRIELCDKYYPHVEKVNNTIFVLTGHPICI